MIKQTTNNATFGPLAIPALEALINGLALGTAATGVSSNSKKDYQTEFLRSHGIIDPRTELLNEYITNTRPNTSVHITQPVTTIDPEWYTPIPGTVYGGAIDPVIIYGNKVDSKIGDAWGVLTGKKTIARDSTQTEQRDSTQTRRDSTQNRRPEPPSNNDDNSGKYFDWSKDMSWSTPTESIFKLMFKPRLNNVHWLRVGANYAPFGIGAYVLGKRWGWWGDKENNDSKQNSNTQSKSYDPNSNWD